MAGLAGKAHRGNIAASSRARHAGAGRRQESVDKGLYWARNSSSVFSSRHGQRRGAASVVAGRLCGSWPGWRRRPWAPDLWPCFSASAAAWISLTVRRHSAWRWSSSGAPARQGCEVDVEGGGELRRQDRLAALACDVLSAAVEPGSRSNSPLVSAAMQLGLATRPIFPQDPLLPRGPKCGAGVHGRLSRRRRRWNGSGRPQAIAPQMRRPASLAMLAFTNCMNFASWPALTATGENGHGRDEDEGMDGHAVQALALPMTAENDLGQLG